MKKTFITCLLLFSTLLHSQITLIPDSGFENALILLEIDSDGEINGQVLTSDIDDLTSLNLIGFPPNSISDLTGIEDFTALEYLEIWQQDITTINLANNVNLLDLHLLTLPLESLDLSNNINLIELQLLTSNVLSELDLSNNLDLEIVDLRFTLLSEIDMSNHLALTDFYLLGNLELEYVNLQNGTNDGVLTFVEINFSNENVICVQVDDPQAVIKGNPPYQYWDIDESITISDNCGFFSVEDVELTSLITLYPNPAQNVLYLDNKNNITIYEIQVHDVLGRMVLLENNPKSQLDISNLAKGLLFVKLETSKGSITKKIIKA